jgi:hypothetical protein
LKEIVERILGFLKQQLDRNLQDLGQELRPGVVMFPALAYLWNRVEGL